MLVGVDARWVVAPMLLSVRLGALVLVAPPLGGGMLPPSVRVVFVLGLAATMGVGRNVSAEVMPAVGLPSAGPLALAVLQEAALGMVMALGLSLAFGAIHLGSRLLDVQMGFGLGQVFDPLTRQQLPVLSAAFNQLAGLGFFLLGGLHGLIKALALSLEATPLGSSWALQPLLPQAIRQAGQMFSLGFALVAPVVFCLVLIDFGLGVLSRNLPQMNTFVIGMPIKVVVGLAMLAIWFGLSGDVLGRIYATSFLLWGALWH